MCSHAIGQLCDPLNAEIHQVCAKNQPQHAGDVDPRLRLTFTTCLNETHHCGQDKHYNRNHQHRSIDTVLSTRSSHQQYVHRDSEEEREEPYVIVR